MLIIRNNSIKHQSFFYSLLNDQTVLFSTSQFSIIIFCIQFKYQFYLTHRYDPIRCNNSGIEWTWERWQGRGTPHSPKLQHYWILTINLFNVLFRTIVGGGTYPSAEMQLVYSAASVDRGSLCPEVREYSSFYVQIYIFE